MYVLHLPRVVIADHKGADGKGRLGDFSVSTVPFQPFRAKSVPGSYR
jgi:hypothetical protein